MRIPVVALIGTVAFTGQLPAQLGRVVSSRSASGVSIVTSNGPTGWVGTTGWKLTLERVVQPPEGAQGMLERPREISLLPDGRLLVVQRNPAAIRLYDAQGKFLQNIGREGDGPGEYRAPTIAVFHDTVVVHDGRQGRASLLTLSGKPVREFLTNIHSDGPRISIDDRGRLRVQSNRQVGQKFVEQWVYFDLNGKRLDSLLAPVAVEPAVWRIVEAHGVSTDYIQFAPQNGYAFLQDGGIIYGSTGAFEFFATRSGKDTSRIVVRTGVKAETIPSAILDSSWQNYIKDPKLAAVAHRSDMPKVYPVWNDLSVDGLGNLWVSAGNSAKTERFDVFDPSGKFLGAVPGLGTGARGLSWNSDHVAQLTIDADDLPIVKIYKIVKPGRR